MEHFLKKVSNVFKKKEKVIARPITIVDVGCRWGFADKFMDYNHSDDMKIYGFDPDVEECERLNAIYKSDAIKLVPIGLSDKEGKKTLFLTKEPGCSSLYKPNEILTRDYPALYCAQEIANIEVNVTTLDLWAKEEGVSYIDYMKIDTQGAELSILQGAVDILPSVRFLEVEVEFNPIYDGQPVFSDVDLYLRGFGFVLWKFSNFAHYSKGNESDIKLDNDSINYDHHRIKHEARGGQLYWADAFYIKKEIVDSAYGEDIIDIARDSNIAEMLGFLDLKSRLDALNSEEER